MSRTFHHGNRTGRKFYERFYPMDIGCEATPKQRRHKDAKWWLITPGWWIHDFMTVKQRAQVRQLLHETMREPTDAPLFPHPKKPHIYFW